MIAEMQQLELCSWQRRHSGSGFSNCVGFKGRGWWQEGSGGRRENCFFLRLGKSLTVTGGTLELDALWALNHPTGHREV